VGQIANKWSEYKGIVLADIEDLAGYEETVFYGGAAATLAVVLDLFESELPPDEVAAKMQDLHQEILGHSKAEIEES
jgi:hypothetical protein